jgi:predicted HTH domain antitoxin
MSLKQVKLINHKGPATLARMAALAKMPLVKTTDEEAKEQVRRHRKSALKNPYPTGP